MIKKKNFPKLTNRSNSMVKIKQEEKKNEKKFFISGKNFYKLFDEKEREAIINGFSSQQDLNKFNEKIEIIGNRNKSIEKMMKNENNQLTKENRIKNTKIVDLEEKNKLFERNISGLQNQLKNQKIINEKLVKQINKFNDEKNNYIEIIKQKDEEINKIKAENNKLMSSMKENKKDIDQEQIRKNQEKEMKSFIDELGIIKVYDINKILNKDIKFTDSSLKKIIGEQFSYHGVTTSIKETEDKKEENQEKTKLNYKNTITQFSNSNIYLNQTMKKEMINNINFQNFKNKKNQNSNSTSNIMSQIKPCQNQNKIFHRLPKIKYKK
jgi:hypothetical protein